LLMKSWRSAEVVSAVLAHRRLRGRILRHHARHPRGQVLAGRALAALRILRRHALVRRLHPLAVHLVVRGRVVAHLAALLAHRRLR
jgi:hypothetical protein